MSAPAPWLIPQWPAPQPVRALCSTRAGGVSSPPFDTLNLGDHVGDQPQAVAANRASYAASLDARPVFLRQVHGQGVVRLDAEAADGTEADACITSQPGLACTIMVADCLPLLLCDDAGQVVGAAHAGWRGLAGTAGQGGVIEAIVDAMRHGNATGSGPSSSRLMAWLGPCIGPQAFEVGEEVLRAFEAHDPNALACFKPHPDTQATGKWYADLAALARQRLAALGIARVHGNDSTSAWCTVSNSSRFFSHRRDRVSGRFAASIWLDDSGR